MEEYVNKLVENTLKKENAKEIIVERILWYEMKLLEKDEKIDKAIEYIEDNTYKSNETEYMDLTGIRELLNILKGEDKE